MAIKTVKVEINGVQHTLEYNNETGKWEKTLSAPNITSYNKEGGYYPVTVTATNEAGTESTLTPADNENLKLIVKERIKPVITLLTPSDGAYISNSLQPISFTVTDEISGSGVNADSITVKIDGTEITTITKNAISNGFNCTCTPASALSDGSHSLEIIANDNDGNSADTVESTFTVDTIPPVLNITSPQNNMVTASKTITVSGVTNDITSSPVVLNVEVNSVDNGTVTVNDDGTFSKNITLQEGINEVIVTATDLAGKTTTITLDITLDTSVPVISNISIFSFLLVVKIV